MGVRVGIDGRVLGSGKFGLSVYAINLICALSHEANEHDITVYLSSLRKTIKDYPMTPKGNLKGRVIRYPHGAFTSRLNDLKENTWMKQVLPHYLKKDAIQLVHILQDYMLPKATGAKTILTVHDLHTFYVPMDSSLQDLDLYKKSCLESDAVISISRYTKKDLVERFKVPEEKIFVVHNGLTIGFGERTSAKDLEATRKKFRLDRPFIFTIGTFLRKNVVTSFKAFEKFNAKRKGSFDFVLAGSLPGIKLEGEYRRLVADLKITERVKILGAVTDLEIEGLMKMSSCLLFPSLCEGFGIPVIEAMQVGCPVVCSNTTSLPEIAGDAALLFDPYDHSGMACAMERIVEDDEFRTRIRESGFLRAKEFSWDRAARQTLDVYRAVMGH